MRKNAAFALATFCVLPAACTALYQDDDFGLPSDAPSPNGEGGEGGAGDDFPSNTGGTVVAPGVEIVSSTGGTSVEDDHITCQSFGNERKTLLTPEHASVEGLIEDLSVGERIGLLSGGPRCPAYDCDWNASGVESANIPQFRVRAGTRGVNAMDGTETTTFAVAIARAATFDLDLEYRVGQVQGIEMRALKYDLALAPHLGVVQHPLWGRSQETYGEDPNLIGQMGAAFINGLQRHIPACAKNFLGGTAEDNRASTSTVMDHRTLHEIYLRPFQIAIDKSDPACIQTDYHRVGGGPTIHLDSDLLTDVLRTELSFSGFVMTEWWATGSPDSSEAADPDEAFRALSAGTDLEMPDNTLFRGLPDGVVSGEDPNLVDTAARRILNVRAHFGQLSEEYQNSPRDEQIAAQESHSEIAYETALKSAVLLENDGVLPLSDKSVVFLGPDRALPDHSPGAVSAPTGLGDSGTSSTTPPHSVSFLAGLEAKGVSVSSSLEPEDASTADVAIIPIVFDHLDEGLGTYGGGDREDLTLGSAHPQHWMQPPAEFIAQAAAVNPNIVVLLVTGGPVLPGTWTAQAAAVVQTFYPGQEGGAALAALLLGEENFSGRLPYTVAQNASDYGVFQNDAVVTNYSYLHGYRRFEEFDLPVAYWFGYGQSYTTFDYSDINVLCAGITAGGRLNVEATVQNTGSVAGTEVVQAYIGYPNSALERPQKELKAFARVTLEPGESQTVQFQIPAKDFAYFDDTTGEWIVEEVPHQVIISSSSDPSDSNQLSAPFTVD